MCFDIAYMCTACSKFLEIRYIVQFLEIKKKMKHSFLLFLNVVSFLCFRMHRRQLGVFEYIDFKNKDFNNRLKCTEVCPLVVNFICYDLKDFNI